MVTAFGTPNPRTGRREVLSSRAANVSAALRTFVLNVETKSRVIVRVELERSAATAITCAAYTGHDLASLAPEHSASVASGTMTHADLTHSKALAVNGFAEFRFDVVGCRYLKCVVAATSGGASDFITVLAEGE